jgi:hypothetical protein
MQAIANQRQGGSVQPETRERHLNPKEVFFGNYFLVQFAWSYQIFLERGC